MLGAREMQVISFIIFGHEIKTKDMEKDLNLTRRQIGYSLKKINVFLIDNNVPPIERKANGTYLVLKDTRQFFIKHFSLKENIDARSKKKVMSDSKEYFDSRLRKNLLFLLLTVKSKHLTEIAEFLKVSQNTILNDIKTLQRDIGQYGLCIRHTRSEGYSVEGKEKLILLRQLKVTDLIRQKSESLNLINFFGGQSVEIINLIQGAEADLKIKYSDDSFRSLQNYIFFFLLRVKNKGYKEYRLSSKIQNTMEFMYVDKAFADSPMHITDKLWLTLLFLSANILQNDNKDINDEIYNASLRFVEEFEKITFTTISDKKTFVKRLYSHVRPLVFRTLYDLPLLGIDLRNYFKNDEEKMFYLFKSIRQSIRPLENLIGKKISDDEIKLISFYFGSELSFGTSQRAFIKKRAVVICSNGIVTAKIMKDNLTRLFPEINFVKTGSAREFANFDLNYDLVFSTIPLDTKKLLYVIDPVMEKEQELNLKKKVLLDLGIESVDLQVEQIVHIVQRNADVKDVNELKSELSRYMSTPRSEKVDLKQNQLNILDYVKSKYIRFTDGNISWEQALRQAAKPLVLDDIVSKDYVNELVTQISNPNSYSFLRGMIAIPHAIPKLGANDNGFGFLISKKPIEFPGHPNVLIIVPIAITGEQDYMSAINQLMLLADNEVLMKRLRHTNSTRIVTKLLSNLS